ncbi:AlpA family phage regulatory protein [Enterobacter cloacae subsp. cloacae]|uniref:helix-turn-helix transcriptional regulator n=1 Tax=Enterobacter cloacae TaxID=550 RepID=UPI001C5B67F5|nr:AlpA family phage regulatory protein [Enterobacter cloacae]ELK6490478.1 AlpA family phage regulatory protein [Enterobacter bugandensis]MBW4198558.1 AlpA family phage regulatory protein [Enterobacter cloacae subsp. cloacae]
MRTENRKILLIGEVLTIMRMKSKTSLYDLIDHGGFPRGVRIGLKRRGWYEDEVYAWIERRGGNDAKP